MGILWGSTPEQDQLSLLVGSSLLGGQNVQQQLGSIGPAVAPYMAQQAQNKQTEAMKQSTLQMLQANDQDLAQAVQAGAMTPQDAVKMSFERKTSTQKAQQPKMSFQKLEDGTYGFADETSGTFKPLGKYDKPVDPTSIQRDLQAAGLQPGTQEYQKAILENYRKNGGQDDYANREAQALKLGIKPDDPRYQSFVLTGKMPREDAQVLTAVDKKAILEADDMVAVNESAITALKQAKDLSGKSNAGWLSGTRATIGNNLPDWMVPDAVSSPESSEATQNFDNAVVGQALTQLKAIFGGAPTEGERKILLDLQGSSNLQPGVRDKILERAIEMAERRLEFNRERAESLRGNTYYKPKDQPTDAPADAVKIGPNGEGYDQVPSGGQYIAPDGTMRVKGGQ